MDTTQPMRFLFWNMNRKSLGAHLRALVDTHNLDVIILCEPPEGWGGLLDTLNHDRTDTKFVYDHLGDEFPRRFTIFSRITSNTMEPIQTTNHASFWALNKPIGLLLVVVHGPDRRNGEDADWNLFAQTTCDKIQRIEQERGHRRTIVVGDFNINPYEDGMMGANMFHAAMTSRTVKRGERQVQGDRYPLFYNPMWSLFGDRTPGPAGTYHHGNPGATVRYWHMLDQLLMRRELIDSFHSVEIVERAGRRSLLTRQGLPDGVGASDHLPLLFCFEFRTGGSHE